MLLNSLITTTQDLLKTYAINEGFASESFTLAFGNEFNSLVLDNLVEEFSQGDFTALPTVEIKPQTDLGGASGVYVSELNQIFLAEEFIDNASENEMVSVLLEEYGHGIDELINEEDSEGDEGFIFSTLVRGESLNDEEWALARAENDEVEVIIDGQVYQAEANTALVVDTLVDEDDGIGVGGISLRDALGAIADEGTITFADSIANGTITLNGTELVIDKSVTIDGDTDNITIDGNNNSRVFNINDGTNTDKIVNISNLTITGGNAPVSSGGGITNTETLTLSNSTISSNNAGYGGGIYSGSTATTIIVNSTISSNYATFAGGVSNYNGTINISNSTISGNTASLYGGGVYNNYGTTNISSSIVSGNSADTGSEIANYGGTITANSNNLFGDSSKSNTLAFSNFTPGANDITATSDGTNPTVLESILDPNGLQDNGGSTQTIALASNSPAIDAGSNPDGLTTDQRGLARDNGNGVDIGAFEVFTSLEVDTLIDEDDGDLSAENLSLREALSAIADGGTITFADSIADGTITLNGSRLVIDKSVTIDGDTDNITIDGNNGSRVFNINDGDNNNESNVTLSVLTITGGKTSGGGGGIYNRESLILNSSTISGNESEYGGGVDNRSTATIRDLRENKIPVM